ncbi:MAG TPA: hypothetical protein VHW01_04930 [Polyangiaceae bacterium]|jgi:hypothetical protein|nr:hypothetical protein [Polyangiaceae bacterium]
MDHRRSRTLRRIAPSPAGSLRFFTDWLGGEEIFASHTLQELARNLLKG